MTLIFTLKEPTDYKGKMAQNDKLRDYPSKRTKL